MRFFRKLHKNISKCFKTRLPIIMLVCFLNKNYPLTTETANKLPAPQIKITRNLRGGSNFHLQPTTRKTIFLCKVMQRNSQLKKIKVFFTALYYKKAVVSGFISKQSLSNVVKQFKFNFAIDQYFRQQHFNNIIDQHIANANQQRLNNAVDHYMINQQQQFFEEEENNQEFIKGEEKTEKTVKSDSILSKSRKSDHRSEFRTRKISKKGTRQDYLSPSQVRQLYNDSKNYSYSGSYNEFLALITDNQLGIITQTSIDEARFAIYSQSINATRMNPMNYPSKAEFLEPEFNFLGDEYLNADILFTNSTLEEDTTVGEMKAYRPPGFGSGNYKNLTKAISKHADKLLGQESRYANNSYVNNIILGINTEYLSPEQAEAYEAALSSLPLSNKTRLIMANLTDFLPYINNQ